MFAFKKQERRKLDKAVRAAALPATKLIVSKAEANELAPLSTHFGGAPHAEKGDTWPTWEPENHPYDFVCQINLSECPNAPAVSFDLLLVFLCWKAIEAVDVQDACLVRSYRTPSNSKAVELPRPIQLDEDDYQIAACKVRTEAAVTYPWSLDRHDAILKAATQFRNPRGAYNQALKRVGYREPFFSRVGGFPTWVHDNTLEDEDMIFVAQINYEPSAKNGIGDAAPIYIAVSASDPMIFETDVWQSF
jgi:uncharacterized protein YwqG